MADNQKPTWEILQANFKDDKILQVIWAGEANTLQFRHWDTTTARPTWIRYDSLANQIIVCFPFPNNVQIVPKEEYGYITLWCEPVVTKEQLEAIQAENEKVEILQ